MERDCEPAEPRQVALEPWDRMLVAGGDSDRQPRLTLPRVAATSTGADRDESHDFPREPLTYMGKVIIIGVVLVAFAAYLHGRGASAAGVAGCLTKAGASVQRSTFLEDTLGAPADGEQIPPGLTNELRDADKHLYDVTIAGDSGVLMVTKQGAAKFASAINAGGGVGTAQGRGSVLMIWDGVPSSTSTAALDRCLR